MSFPSLSIKSKVTLTALVLLIISIWGTVFYIDVLLKRSVKSEIADFQADSLNTLKISVEKDISFGLQTVIGLARHVTPELMNDIPELQRYLDERMNIQAGLFDTGIHICSRDGMTLVETPRTGAVGINYGDRQYFKTVLETGKPYISEPVIGKLIKKPFMTVTAPIFGKDNNVIGVVIGIVGLVKGSFLSQVASSNFGRSGEVYLLSLRDGLFVRGYQNVLSLQKISGSEEEKIFGKYIEGYEGTSMEKDEAGNDLLVSGLKMMNGDWLIASSIPAKAAFSTVANLERNILYVMLLATFVTLGIVWYLLHVLLKPLLDVAAQIKAMSDEGTELKMIEIHKDDEVGVLIDSFNALQQKRKALEENLRLFEQARRTSIMELLNNIAHQWRQPLNIVTINLGNIEDKLESDIDKNELEDLLQKSVKELQELSKTVTWFTSFYNTYKDVGRSKLKDIIQNILPLFKNCDLKEYSIELEIEDDLYVFANESIFAEILSSMINNSLEISEQRGIDEIEIRIKAVVLSNMVEIKILDNCGGIDKEVLNTLFDPYTTTYFKHRGKGMGLFMVKKAVEENLKGEIFVRNLENGAEFLIRMPLA